MSLRSASPPRAVLLTLVIFLAALPGALNASASDRIAERLAKVAPSQPSTISARTPTQPNGVPGTSRVLAVPQGFPAIVDAVLAPSLQAATPATSRVAASFAPAPIDAPALGVAIPDALRLVDSLHYVVCAQWATGSGCAPRAPLGTPVPLDATGDGVPDVTAHLTPSVRLASPTGFTVSWSVTRLDVANPRLPAHVYAMFQIPQTQQQFAIGFDGRASSLSRRSELTFTLNDVVQALAGNIGFTGALTNEGPATSEALTFHTAAVTVAGATPIDPIDARVAFSPLPRALQVDGQLTRVPEPSYTFDLSSSVRTRVEASLTAVTTARASRDEITGVIDTLPTHARLRLLPDALGGMTVQYDADGTIDRAAFSARSIRNIAQPDSFTLVSGEARGVPRTIGLVFSPDPLSVSYTASSVMPSLAFALEQRIAGAVVNAVSARAVDVPDAIKVRATQSPMSLTYDASSVLSRLTASVQMDATVASLDIRDLPAAVAINATDSSFDLRTNDQIGSIDAALSVNGLPVVAYDGEYASVSVGAPGSQDLAAGLRLTHIGSVHVEKTGPPTDSKIAGRVTLPGRGAMPLLVHADGPEFDVTGVLSSVPEQIDIAVEMTPIRRTFSYSAPQRIDLLTFHGTLGTTTLAAELVDLPTDVSLTIDPAGVGYQASAPITSLRVQGRITSATSTTDLAVAVEDIPKLMHLAWTSAPASVAFTGSDAIGSIKAQVRINGASAGAIDGTDHVVFRQNGDALGISAQVSGLKALSVDPTGTYSLTLVPGGQRFVAAAAIDADRFALLEISALPRTIDVTVVADTVGEVNYVASDPIDSVRVAMQTISTGNAMLVEVDDVPASIHAAWRAKPEAPLVTYDASSRVSHVYTFYRDRTGGDTLEASVNGVPAYFHVEGAIRRPNVDLVFDARTAASAAPGSGSVDSVAFRYGSLGTFLTSVPSIDHVVLRQTLTSMQMDVTYSGLRYASARIVDKVVDVALQNTAARPFSAAVDIPTLLLNASIEDVPSDLQIHYRANEATGGSQPTLSYLASSPIHALNIDLDMRDGQLINAHIQELPRSIDLSIDLTLKTVRWEASAATAGIQLVARLAASGPMWDLDVAIDTLPAVWHLAWHPKFPIVFQGDSGTLRQARATVTNHHVVTTSPGSHVNVVSTAGGDIDASFLVKDLSLVRFEKTRADSFDAIVRMGNGVDPFAVSVNIEDPEGTRAMVDLRMSPLPADLHISSVLSRIEFTSSSNFDLAVEAQMGENFVLGAMPWDSLPLARPGAFIRQYCNTTGCPAGVKLKVLLLGAPTYAMINPGPSSGNMLQIDNFNPPSSLNSLTVDAIMGDMKIMVVQLDVPRLARLAFFFHVDSPQGKMDVDYRTSPPPGSPPATMGPLSLAFEGVSRNSGVVKVSNIPSSFNLATTLRDTDKLIIVALAQPISRIETSLVLGPPPETPTLPNKNAHILLTDVPTAVTLRFGTSADDYNRIPLLSYSASAIGLDVDASVSGTFETGRASPLAPVETVASLTATDLGRVITTTFQRPPPVPHCGQPNQSIGSLGMVSDPPTAGLTLRVSAHIAGNFSMDSDRTCYNMIEFRDNSTASIEANIDDLQLKVTDLKDLTIGLGVSTSIQGNYGSMGLNWQAMRLRLGLDANVYYCPGGGLACFWIQHYTQTHNVTSVTWYQATNHITPNLNPDLSHPGRWVAIPIPGAVCGGFVHVSLHISPHQHQISVDGFTVAPPGPGEGDAWIVTPDPNNAIAPNVMAVIAGMTSPLDRTLIGTPTVTCDAIDGVFFA
jgi:hypothetical protein